MNRRQSLELCLEGLGNQKYPSTLFEVIIVNDGGDRLPQGFFPKLRQNLSVQILYQANRGPGPARNAGVRAAQGEFLAFTDDDCLPDPNWLTALQASFQDAGPCAVGGRTTNGLGENPYATASQLLIHFLYEYYHLQQVEKTQMPFFSSNNLGIDRQVFQELGGFDGQLRTAEDRDLCARLLEAGFALRYAPAARVHHFHDLDLKRYLIQHFQYGRGNYEYHKLRHQRGRGSYRLEPLRFYSGMLQYPFSQMRTRYALWQSVLLMLSQFGNISGFFAQALIKALHK